MSTRRPTPPRPGAVGRDGTTGAARPAGVGGRAPVLLERLARLEPGWRTARDRVGTRVVLGARLARRRWRGSLLLRVATATTVLGVLVVLVVGNLMLARIAGGLVDSRRSSAMAESADLVRQAKEQLGSVKVGSAADLQQYANTEVVQLEAKGDPPNRLAYILGDVRSDTSQVVSNVGSPHASMIAVQTVIPTALRRAVHENTRQLQSMVVQYPAEPRPVTAITVGTVLDLGPVAQPGQNELFFVYRLDREMEIIDLVRRAFIIGGALLVLLVAGVALVVTRQVVAPVRQAARTAEELASGNLERRMRVRGEDDLARLGRAFNEMAASLERQILRLEELSRVQRRFVSDVSHELRTPLTTIRMATEVIHEARGDFDPAVSRSAELLTGQLDRFEALLGDLLEVSRFDAGAAVLETEPADMADLVARVADGLRPLAERRGVPLVVHLPAEPSVAEIDSRRVERVLRNLVGNAIEHGEGRPVDIRLVQDDDAVAVGVRDHGVGLAPAQARMVFNRFWRADPARARSTGGTGLGLAISLEDAHLHGGWLQVWGRPGLGAHFRLTLPRRAGVELTTSPLPLEPPLDATPLAGLGRPVVGHMPAETS